MIKNVSFVRLTRALDYKKNPKISAMIPISRAEVEEQTNLKLPVNNNKTSLLFMYSFTSFGTCCYLCVVLLLLVHVLL